MMVDEGDDDAAALGFVSPHSDASGFGRGAAERQRPAFARCARGLT